MKQSLIKKIARLTLLIVMLSLTQCQNEEIGLDNKLAITSEKVKFSDVLKETANPILKDYLTKLQSSLEFQKTQKNQEEAFFNKIMKGNIYDTYTLALNRFSINEPYFTFFIIQKKGGNESAGIVKYIPTNANPVLDVKHFTGSIEFYDITDYLYAKSSFSNGVPAQSKQSNISSKSCTNSISIITHPCTHGNGHLPGQSCGNGYVNDAYYEIVIARVCTRDPTVLQAPPEFMGEVGGGGPGPDLPTPCDKLKELADPAKQNIKGSIDWLKSKVNGTGNSINNLEYSVEFKNFIGQDNNIHYTNTQVPPGNQFNTTIRIGKRYTGGGHNHPSNSYGMFSYGDLKFLVDAYEEADDDFKDQVTSIVVCEDDILFHTTKVYAMKINPDNYQMLRDQVYAIWDSPKYAGKGDLEKLTLINNELGEKFKNSNGELEKCFLQKFGSTGFSLYKANDDTMANWSKLELSNTTPLTVISNPCN